MNKLSIRRFGFATGSSMAVTYIGCVIVKASVSTEQSIRFFNSIMHGVDVTSIVRTEMPLSEMIIGVLEVFVIGWLFGAVMACFYNISARLDGRRVTTAKN